MGKDIVLQDRSAELAKSLRSMIQSPHECLVATFKTLQAMVCPTSELCVLTATEL